MRAGPAAGGRAEVAFEVAAQWRHHGIASALLNRLLESAAYRGLHEVYAEVLPENANMLAVLREHGEHAESRDQGIVSVTLPAPEAPHTRACGPPVVAPRLSRPREVTDHERT